MVIEPWHVVVLCTAVKALLIPAYRSTDFEVHRHWLSVTHSLPLSKWYKDVTSEWTLDYPPFFAWFEWVLSQAASLIDPAMLTLGNLDYASHPTVVFQRATVMASEFILFGATWYATRRRRRGLRVMTLFLVAAHPGLIIVDHIHFQYNGVLLGLFVLSMTLVAEGRDLAGGITFAVLLNMKHIFLYAAPVYFVHLLRHYCRGPQAVKNFLVLGTSVSVIFAASLGPFVAMGQLPQVLKRLFPFARGLCHAYWAPNMWALYAAADKVLGSLLPRLGVPVRPLKASMTGGLVGVAEFAALPQVGSRATVAAVLLAMTPCLVATWRRPNPERFPEAVLYATMCSFMLGYHVHEKAILMVVIPLAVLVGVRGSPAAASSFLFLSTLGTYSLFPLLTGLEEYPIKVLLLALYTYMASCLLMDFIMPPLDKARPVASTTFGMEGPSGSGLDPSSSQASFDAASSATRKEVALEEEVEEQHAPVLLWYERAYVYCIILVELYSSLLHRLLLKDKLPFLPLILVSVFCALGMVYAWARMAAPYLGSWAPSNTRQRHRKQV